MKLLKFGVHREIDLPEKIEFHLAIYYNQDKLLLMRIWEYPKDK